MIPYFEKNLFIHSKVDMAILDISFFEQDVNLWKELTRKVIEISNREQSFTNFLSGRLADNTSLKLRNYDVISHKKAITTPRLLKGEDLENGKASLIFPTGGIVICDVPSLEKRMPNVKIPEENVFSNILGYVTIARDVTKGPFIHIARQTSVLPAIMYVTLEFFEDEEPLYI